MTFKQFYFVVTAAHRWGRGTNREQAMKEAGIDRKSKTEYIVNIGIVKDEATNEQLENLWKLWYVNDWGGVNQCDSLMQDDKDQIKNLFVGWISEHFNIPKDAKK